MKLKNINKKSKSYSINLKINLKNDKIKQKEILKSPESKNNKTKKNNKKSIDL